MILLPQNIQEEIMRHDLGILKPVPLDHGGVTAAIAYFLNNSMPEMAEHLRQMAQAGFIRQGPFDGFVAAGVSLPQGEFIMLSNIYPEYNTNFEIMASLVQEIGFLSAFNRSLEANELRAQKALSWFSIQKPVAAPVSFIASAVLKTERKMNGM